MKMHEIGTLKFIAQCVSQLKGNLKKENLNQKNFPSNQRDDAGQHRRCKGAAKEKLYKN